MDLSVVITTYNRKQFLGLAIDSVLKQSLPVSEILVIDDASTDGTESEFANASFSVPFRFFQNVRNGGVSFSRNFGVSQCKSPWVAFLDCDDVWHPDKWLEQSRILNSEPGLDWIQTQEVWIRDGGVVPVLEAYQKSNSDFFKQAMQTTFVTVSSLVLRKTSFHQLGGFREDLPFLEDYDFGIKLSALLRGGLVEQRLISKFGGHHDQLSSQIRNRDFWKTKILSSLPDVVMATLENSPTNKAVFQAERNFRLQNLFAIMSKKIPFQNFLEFQKKILPKIQISKSLEDLENQFLNS